MIFSSLVPPFLKEFLPYISPRALKVVPIRALSEQALVTTRRLMTGEGTEALRENLAGVLPTGVQFATPQEVRQQSRATRIEALDAKTRREIGQRILRLYFAQLERSTTIFLDLRPKHFAWEPGNGELLWAPSNLWTRWNPEFRRSLLDLYTGFYLEDNARFEAALIALKLLPESPEPADAERIQRLFRDHFGTGDQTRVEFRIESLKSSFHEIFGELERKKRQVHPDFAFLGIYLTSLYLSLEEIGEPLDARGAFLEFLELKPGLGSKKEEVLRQGTRTA